MKLRATLTLASLATALTMTGFAPAAVATTTCVVENTLCVTTSNLPEGDPVTQEEWSACFGARARNEQNDIGFRAASCYAQAPNSNDPSETCRVADAQVPTQPYNTLVKSGCE